MHIVRVDIGDIIVMHLHLFRVQKLCAPNVKLAHKMWGRKPTFNRGDHNNGLVPKGYAVASSVNVISECPLLTQI